MEDTKLLESQASLEKALDDLKTNSFFYSSFSLYSLGSATLGAYSVLRPSLLEMDPVEATKLSQKMRDVFGDDMIERMDNSVGISLPVIVSEMTAWTNEHVNVRRSIENLPEYADLMCVAMNANLAAYDLANKSIDPSNRLFGSYIAGMKGTDPNLEPIKDRIRLIMTRAFDEDFVKELDEIVDMPEKLQGRAVEDLISGYRATHESVPEDQDDQQESSRSNDRESSESDLGQVPENVEQSNDPDVNKQTGEHREQEYTDEGVPDVNGSEGVDTQEDTEKPEPESEDQFDENPDENVNQDSPASKRAMPDTVIQEKSSSSEMSL